jgi:large subunit ribosomal protein L6
MPVPIPDKVKVDVDGQQVHVEGPLGELTETFRDEVEIVLEDGELVVKARGESNEHRAMHGLTRTLINNMVVGVSQGYQKILLLAGIGYTAELKGSGVMLRVGYSHPVWIGAPPGVKFELLQPSQWSEAGIEKQVDNQNVAIRVSGYHKALVGQVAARIRRIRPAEPYKGKGIRYNNEHVRRKAGKQAK